MFQCCIAWPIFICVVLSIPHLVVSTYLPSRSKLLFKSVFPPEAQISGCPLLALSAFLTAQSPGSALAGTRYKYLATLTLTPVTSLYQEWGLSLKSVFSIQCILKMVRIIILYLVTQSNDSFLGTMMVTQQTLNSHYGKYQRSSWCFCASFSHQ